MSLQRIIRCINTTSLRWGLGTTRSSLQYLVCGDLKVLCAHALEYFGYFKGVRARMVKTVCIFRFKLKHAEAGSASAEEVTQLLCGQISHRRTDWQVYKSSAHLLWADYP